MLVTTLDWLHLFMNILQAFDIVNTVTSIIDAQKVSEFLKERYPYTLKSFKKDIKDSFSH